jgi:Protein of unknown function (DUF2958)
MDTISCDTAAALCSAALTVRTMNESVITSTGSPAESACESADTRLADDIKLRRLEMAVKKLVTDAERAQLLANGGARTQGQDGDPMPVVKLFTPDAHATWLLTELDPADGDTAFGLCDLGLCMPALGTVRLSDLETIRGPRNLPVQRDLYFKPRFLLSEYVRRAQADGSIND